MLLQSTGIVTLKQSDACRCSACCPMPRAHGLSCHQPAVSGTPALWKREMSVKRSFGFVPCSPMWSRVVLPERSGVTLHCSCTTGDPARVLTVSSGEGKTRWLLPTVCPRATQRSLATQSGATHRYRMSRRCDLEEGHSYLITPKIIAMGPLIGHFKLCAVHAVKM